MTFFLQLVQNPQTWASQDQNIRRTTKDFHERTQILFALLGQMISILFGASLHDQVYINLLLILFFVFSSHSLLKINQMKMLLSLILICLCVDVSWWYGYGFFSSVCWSPRDVFFCLCLLCLSIKWITCMTRIFKITYIQYVPIL